MESISPEDLKNSIVILALDNLASIYEIALEDTQNMPKDEVEYLQFIIGYSRSLIQQIGESISNKPIPRPQWKTNL